MVKNIEKSVYVFITESLRTQHNTVNQLYFNKNK